MVPGVGGRDVTRAKKLMSVFMRGQGRVPLRPMPRRVDSWSGVAGDATRIGVVATTKVSGREGEIECVVFGGGILDRALCVSWECPREDWWVLNLLCWEGLNVVMMGKGEKLFIGLLIGPRVGLSKWVYALLKYDLEKKPNICCNMHYNLLCRF